MFLDSYYYYYHNTPNRRVTDHEQQHDGKDGSQHTSNRLYDHKRRPIVSLSGTFFITYLFSLLTDYFLGCCCDSPVSTYSHSSPRMYFTVYYTCKKNDVNSYSFIIIYFVLWIDINNTNLKSNLVLYCCYGYTMSVYV